jgi:Tol biopolymer transport system component
VRHPTKIVLGLVGASAMLAVACGPPPPPPPPPPPGTTTSTTTSTTTPPPGPKTFLAGKPAPGKVFDGDASRVQISSDGNWVVYHHGARTLDLVNPPPASCPRPANTHTQIYRTNLLTGATELVSVDPATGCYGNEESTFPDVSADGRYVAYGSRATNLGPIDGNGGRFDIYLKDMVTGQVSLISVTNSGGPSNEDSNRPDLNGDASLIAYNSRASNLVPGDSNGQSECFLTQRANPSAVQRVSLGNRGQQLDGFTYRCKLSGDATRMVFDSQSTNAFDTPMSGNYQVYLRDLVSGQLTLVSRRTDGSPSGAAVRPDISESGGCVAFQSSDRFLVQGETDPDTNTDVFLYNIASATTRIMSVDRNGNHVDAASDRIVVNADCTKVAFTSNSNKLVPEDRNQSRDTFMRDLTTGEIFLLSVNTAGQQAQACPPPPGGTTTTSSTTTVPGSRDTTGANDISTRPSISDDGRVVAFNSDMCNLVPEEPQMAGLRGTIVRWMRSP